MKLKGWTAEKLAGQRLMAGFEGTRFSRSLERLIAGLRLGGLILFRRNVESPRRLADLCRSAQACARNCGLPPLLIAVDQEGGPVARLGPPFTVFPGNPAMEDAGDADRFAAITAIELGSVGINMNLAPVLDVAPREFDSIMAGRSFGPDPLRAAQLGAAVIEGLQRRGIMAVAKHFPGIGRTSLDSHLDLPVLDDSAGSLDVFDLIPFRSAFAHSVAAVMLSHILYPQLDPLWPASLSRPIACGLLRRRMGFEGVVMTDDLEMGAVTRHCGLKTAVRQVLRAEIDIALICRSAGKQKKAYRWITRKIGESEGARRRAENSAARILLLKNTYLPS
jgi:beta-N-acetylhexosaminidase